jgi:NADP-dependent 3-hydroxy acid dehydrogenase YdfG
VFFGIKYAIPAMIANGGGSIVNLSSIAGIIGSEHVHAATPILLTNRRSRHP